MTAWNFGEGRHEYSEVLGKHHHKYFCDSYGQKMWKMVIYATLSRTDRTLRCQGYMECLYKFKKSTLWSCCAEIEMKRTNNYASTGMNWRILFDCFTKIKWLYFVLKADDCFPDGNESAFNEAFHFVINFRILSLDGVQNRSISDFSPSQNIDSEVTVLVGEQRLYVDKYPLMSFSPVLCDIINNGINSNNEIEIKDAKVEDVVAFLRLLYRQKPLIKFGNVEGLMSLIIRYDAQCVIPVVEEELISTVKTTLEQKFHISELYSFSELQKVALQQQATEEKRKMERKSRLLEKKSEMQRLAVKQKETSDMIRVFQQKVNEDKIYVRKMDTCAGQTEHAEHIKESMKKAEKERKGLY